MQAERVQRGWHSLIGGLCAVAFGLFLYGWVDDQHAELQRDGRPVAGEVVDSRSRAKGGHTLDVTFRHAGRDRELSMIVHDDDDDPYRVGQEVTVLVDRDDPGRVTMRGEPNDDDVPFLGTLRFLMVFFGGGLALFGLIGCVSRLARRRRRAGVEQAV